MEKLPLSVVVITRNEENNIEPCLKSVHGWADEIVVVDDGSTDGTVRLAGKYTDKIFHRRMENEGIHRNWAYAQAKNEWVLSIDADERVTEELQDEIAQAIKTGRYQAYSVPLRNYIGDHWVRYCGWYPAGKTRLFMKSRFKYEEVGVHPRVFVDGETGHLTKDIIHRGIRDVAHFLSGLNAQTTLEARKWIQTGRRMSLGKALWRTFDRFPRSYLRKKGYKEGHYGFVVALFASLYEIISYVKFVEMKEKSRT